MAVIDVIQGAKVLWFIRLLSEETTESAMKLAFQTEGDLNEAREVNSTVTKDGTKNSLAQLAVDGSITTLYSNDPNEDKVRLAFREGEKFGFWKIDSAIQGTDENEGKYRATYLEGNLTERSESAGSEDIAEVNYSYTGEGVPKEGWVTLTAEQAAFVQYKFKDITPLTVPAG